MKTICKILILAVLFSMTVGIYAYAEETKTEEMNETSTEAVDTTLSVSSPITAETPPARPIPVKVLEAAYNRVVTPSVPVESATSLRMAEKTTVDNLRTAFAGESDANARYLAFAEKADEEGYGKVANLFRAAARAEQVHFERHGDLLKKLGVTPIAPIQTPVVKSTAENLQTSIDGETYESTKMYPEFLSRAKLDKNQDAIDVFEEAGVAEAVHAKLYKQALDNLKTWKGRGNGFYVCPVCGNVTEQKNFRDCPICGMSIKKFLTIR